MDEYENYFVSSLFLIPTKIRRLAFHWLCRAGEMRKYFTTFVKMKYPDYSYTPLIRTLSGP